MMQKTFEFVKVSTKSIVRNAVKVLVLVYEGTFVSWETLISFWK